MPQMSPMNWLGLYFYFSVCLYFFLIKAHFFLKNFLKNSLESKSVKSKSYLFFI